MTVEIDKEDLKGDDLPKDKLERVIAMCQTLEERKEKVKEAEGALKKAKADLAAIELGSLPALFEELGLPFLGLPSGATVAIESDVKTKIPAAKHGAAMAWLIKRDFGGLIKTAVSVSFGRGEREDATEAIQVMSEAGLEPELKEEVHHSTLESFVKERLEAGDDIPFDLFGVHQFNKAVIKPKK